MTPPTLTSLPQSSPRRARHRRVKRGIVAGYLHELTQRHGDGTSQRPVSLPLPVAPAAAQPER
jgi:hypothetical protein